MIIRLRRGDEGQYLVMTYYNLFAVDFRRLRQVRAGALEQDWTMGILREIEKRSQ